jgi:peptidoglycan/xylan/chitin deacetylase (PgdA/CDA1 family)
LASRPADAAHHLHLYCRDEKPLPDIPNWAWHEYGQLVGFWRLKAIFDEFDAPATLILNGSVCDSYPQIVDAAVESGWDTAGHGWIQKSLPAVDDQRGDIIKTYQRIAEHTGTPPRGWLGPSLAETQDTVDWLKETGFDYVADWVLDDQPVDIRTRHGTLVGLPYTGDSTTWR